MYCHKCGTQFDGNYCPQCGEPAIKVTAPPPRPQSPTHTNNRMNPGIKCMLLGIAGLIFTILGFGIILSILSLKTGFTYHGEQKTGQTAKKIGMICSWISVVLTLLIVWGMILSENAASSENPSDEAEITESIPEQEESSSEESEWDMEEYNREGIEQIESDIESIKENVSEIWNDPDVQDAYDNYKESIKEAFGGE